MTHDIALAQGDRGIKDLMLLDSGSNAMIFNSKRLATNTKKKNEGTRKIYCTALIVHKGSDSLMDPIAAINK